jgi:hypothetical protein
MDSRFRTKAGLKVDDEITVLYNDLDIRPYFELRGPVGKDGWQPVIGGMSSVEDAFLERVREKGKLTTTIDRFVKSED